MPVTDDAVQKFLSRLSAARSVISRKMFGGIGIYSDGIFFAVIDDDRLYFKVDSVNLSDFEAYGAEQWSIPGPNGGAMPYREVPAEVLEDMEKVGYWIDQAVAVAQRKKKK